MCYHCGNLYHQASYTIANVSLNNSTQAVTTNSSSGNIVFVPRDDSVSIQEGTFDTYWNVDANGEPLLGTPTLITFVWDSPNSPTDSYRSGNLIGGFDGTPTVQYNNRGLSGT